MAGLIGLLGGEEFMPGCEDADLALLRSTGVESPRVLIVPTAAAQQNPSRAAANGIQYFSKLGARADALMVLGQTEASDVQVISAVDKADLIYLTGGNPLHLLRTLNKSRFFFKICCANRRGAVIVGSSAGAMVLGSWMNFRGWKRTLNFIQNTVIMCHHEPSQSSNLSDKSEWYTRAGITVLGIESKTSVIISGRDRKVLGPGTVTSFLHGRWNQYTKEQCFRHEKTNHQSETA